MKRRHQFRLIFRCLHKKQTYEARRKDEMTQTRDSHAAMAVSFASIRAPSPDFIRNVSSVKLTVAWKLQWCKGKHTF